MKRTVSPSSEEELSSVLFVFLLMDLGKMTKTVIVTEIFCYFFTTKHLGVLKNSLKRVRAFLIELEFGGICF